MSVFYLQSRLLGTPNPSSLPPFLPSFHFPFCPSIVSFFCPSSLHLSLPPFLPFLFLLPEARWRTQEEDLPFPWRLVAGGELLHRDECGPHSQACRWHQGAGRTLPSPSLRQGRAEPREEYYNLLLGLSTERSNYFLSHSDKRS